MLKPFLSTARRAMLGLGATALAPLASAAIVTGFWDPPLPSPAFTNLGWTAVINLKIADDCRDGAQSLPYIVNLFGRSFGCNSSPFDSEARFSILSAEVGIYRLDTLTIVDVLRFDPLSFRPLLLDINPGVGISYLLSLRDSNIVGGGITATDVTSATIGYDFRLSLPGEAPAIKYRDTVLGGDFTTAKERPTPTGYALNVDAAEATVRSATRLEVNQRIFNAVPEPGALGLALLALGAAGVAAHGAAGRAARRRTGQPQALPAA